MKENKKSTQQGYDVALSYASEDSDYVEKVAETLKNCGLNVFFAKNEQAKMWGRNLNDFFEEVFTHADTVVAFFSDAYISKTWPNYERQIIESEFLNRKEDYFLPVKMEESSNIKGFPASIAYIEKNQYTPEALANLIREKRQMKKGMEEISFEKPASQITESKGFLKMLSRASYLEKNLGRKWTLTTAANFSAIPPDKAREYLDAALDANLVEWVVPLIGLQETSRFYRLTAAGEKWINHQNDQSTKLSQEEGKKLHEIEKEENDMVISGVTALRSMDKTSRMVCIAEVLGYVFTRDGSSPYTEKIGHIKNHGVDYDYPILKSGALIKIGEIQIDSDKFLSVRKQVPFLHKNWIIAQGCMRMGYQEKILKHFEKEIAEIQQA